MRISVIVPTLNEALRIEACLRSVQGAPANVRGWPSSTERGSSDTNADIEIIVVDGGSTDGTMRLASPLATVGSASRGRATQMNAGARLATGDVLLFLHADSLLPAGWRSAIEHALSSAGTVGGTFRLRFDRDTPMLRLYAFCTHFQWRLFHYGDQGIFVRRATFGRMRGFREMPLMEDVNFLARLRAEGHVSLLPLDVTTSSRRFDRHGVVGQQVLNAILMGLYGLGVPVSFLARFYEHVGR